MNLFQGVLDKLTPVGQPAEQTQATVNGPQQPDLATRWRNWASKPENSAALMQTGISLLQPLQLGQNTLGAIGSAIGSGAELRDQVAGPVIRPLEDRKTRIALLLVDRVVAPLATRHALRIERQDGPQLAPVEEGGATSLLDIPKSNECTH